MRQIPIRVIDPKGHLRIEEISVSHYDRVLVLVESHDTVISTGMEGIYHH